MSSWRDLTLADESRSPFQAVSPPPHAKKSNKSLEQNALHASCALLSSQQPARRTPGVAELVSLQERFGSGVWAAF
jgi:hypothetical protein